MNLGLSEIAVALSATLTGQDLNVDGVSIDSRTLTPGALFVALKGPHFDGHEFCGQAMAKGASALMVERPVVGPLPQLIVQDSRLALAELAGYWRSRLSLRLAGITGSNGKTTVKEMTAAILRTEGPVGLTQGNLNNDIGVPLTLLRLTEQQRFGVIEMGANHLGEIDYSSRYARPDAAVITNIGPAHLEGFGSLINTGRGKGEIYHHLARDGVAVMPYGQPYEAGWRSRLTGQKVLTFGLESSADVRAEAIEAQGLHTKFTMIYQGARQPVRLSLSGEHNVVNALAAGALSLALGLSLPGIAEGLAAIKPVSGRLQPKPGLLGCLLLDDSYNANPASVRAGASVLLKLGREPWVVLGALAELGPESETMHEQLGVSLRGLGIKRLWAVGAEAQAVVHGFGRGGQWFSSHDEVIEALRQAITGSEALLIKGSRSQRMEQVVAALAAEETE